MKRNYKAFTDPEFVEIEYIDCATESTQGWYDFDAVKNLGEMPMFPLIARGWLVAEDDRSYMLMHLRVGPMRDDSFEYSVDSVIQKGPGTELTPIEVTPKKIYPNWPPKSKPKSVGEYNESNIGIMSASELVKTMHKGMKQGFEQQRNDELRKRGRCPSRPVFFEPSDLIDDEQKIQDDKDLKVFTELNEKNRKAQMKAAGLVEEALATWKEKVDKILGNIRDRMYKDGL